jgi:large subunit ribosomal protein L24
MMKRKKRMPVQPKFHVKKNDLVVVLAGTSRGQRGKILQVLRNQSRVLVEGLNLRKKATRKTQESAGGIVEREAALPISNVMLAERYDNRRGAKSHEKKTASKHTAPKHDASKHTAPKHTAAK